MHPFVIHVIIFKQDYWYHKLRKEFSKLQSLTFCVITFSFQTLLEQWQLEPALFNIHKHHVN